MRAGTFYRVLAMATIHWLVVASAVACRMKGAPSSSAREFEPLAPMSSKPLTGFRLAGAAGVPTRAYRDIYDWGRGMENAHLRIEFPSLSRGRFERLRANYGFGLSRVQFKQGQTYELRDFLTPMMQAVLNHRFRIEINARYAHLQTNCWSTGYEALRSARSDASSFVLWMAESPGEIDRAFTRDFGGERLTVATTLDQLRVAPGKRFGDLVLQYDATGELEHVAMVVDNDVYFEKTAFITESAFRLTTGTDWAYPPESGARLEVWRFDPARLPDPATLFRTRVPTREGAITRDVQGPLLTMTIPWVEDALGRSRLTEASYRPLVMDKPPGY